MTNNQNPKYDLEERTAQFGENIIKLCIKLPKSSIVNPLIVQLIKSGTSVGANYSEADDAESKQDFRHKIGLCRKESKESMHWLRMIVKANSNKRDSVTGLWKEAKELTLIFSSIFRS